LEVKTIENIEAKVKKKGKNLVIHPQKCPMSLSICLWKQNGSNQDGSRNWKEIERCYAYSGHEDGTVKCRWKEIFLRPSGKRIKKKQGAVRPGINVSGTVKRIKNRAR
jgi:hypothetical protein